MTGKKHTDKLYYRHSGYPGGLKATPYGELLAKRPEDLVRMVVRGMLPHNTLGKLMLRKLKVYRGVEHPHAAQQPEPINLES
jgi:large subunit ribosomal protein L13